MNTPICDFVNECCESGNIRLHMPGHKGKDFLGFEKYDITEIDGADSLYHASGIIEESENNASSLFGTGKTCYSCEGSSLCIRAMLYLTMLYAKENGRQPLVLAGRNAHKTFVTAAALLNINITWLYPEENESYLSCSLSSKELQSKIKAEKPCAVYITSPDYLGGMCDIAEISDICRKNGVLLLVDNAHGAYLKFLERSLHPIDLGADMCCDSAHKTLPVLTGGAYLHISKSAPKLFFKQVKNALAFFGSTSPSYLILQSLDKANKYLSDGYKEKLDAYIRTTAEIKAKLSESFTLTGSEPLKITFMPKSYGYTGDEFAKELKKHGFICEFSDPDFTVLMLTPENGENETKKILQAISKIKRKTAIDVLPPQVDKCEAVLSPMAALTAKKETISTESSVGRISASVSVSCPPAVPIVISGERINESAKKAFEYYSVRQIEVVAE
ncbi:MAG: aminotransferase class V-fold PLP-dependent enzyme [Acutalibacteraceae bacterium]